MARHSLWRAQTNKNASFPLWKKIWLNKSSSEVAMVIVNVYFPILFNSIDPLLQERNNTHFSSVPNTGDSYLKMRTECAAQHRQAHDLQGT